MWAFIIFITLFLGLSIPVTNGVDAYFDCQRRGQDCQHEQPCIGDGTCNCSAGYSGYDCSLVQALANVTPCSGPRDGCAHPDGLCFNKDNASACYCPVDVYGPQCEMKRYRLICKVNSMGIFMKPAGNFSGLIYLADHMDDLSCRLSQRDEDKSSGFHLIINDKECGSVVKPKGEQIKYRDVIIQNDVKYVSDLDTRVRVTCNEGITTVKIIHRMKIDTGNERFKQQQIEYIPHIEASNFKLEATFKDGSLVNTMVHLGQLLRFEIFKTPNCTFKTYVDYGALNESIDVVHSIKDLEMCYEKCEESTGCIGVEFKAQFETCLMYTDSEVPRLEKIKGRNYSEKVCPVTAKQFMMIESCSASNTLSGPDQETLLIIENSCPSSDVGKLLKKNPLLSGNTSVSFQLRAFRFNKNNIVSISCTLSVCPEGQDHLCDAVDCGVEKTRRRRSPKHSVTVKKIFMIVQSNNPDTDFSNAIGIGRQNVMMQILVGVVLVMFMGLT